MRAPALAAYLIEWRRRRPTGARFFSTLAGGELGDRYVRRMAARYGCKAGSLATSTPTSCATRPRRPG